MARSYALLIADRNRHVREFLGREMGKEGYQVRLVKAGSELLKWIYDAEAVDLLIMDPDFPDVDPEGLLETIENRIPMLPVVIHAHAPERPAPPGIFGGRVFVEKEGGSIENLKRIVLELLKPPDEKRGAGKGDGPVRARR